MVRPTTAHLSRRIPFTGYGSITKHAGTCTVCLLQPASSRRRSRQEQSGDANSTAIFNTLKTSNDCSSIGADDSAGFTVSELTTSGPFDVFKSVASSGSNVAGVSYPCAISQAQAIAMFEKFNEQIDPCFFTKINAPFSCVSKGPLSVIQRLSLSYANTMLFQGVISGIIVQIFFSSQRSALRKGIRPKELDETPA